MHQNIAPSVLDRDLIATAYERSLALLRHNATADGMLAASRTPQARERNYDTLFGRDAAICALGQLASGEADLIACARAGLLTLGRSQAANGQIPNFVRPASGEVDFWYAGCIDASLWWLIAIRWYDRLSPGSDLAGELAPQIERALHWLECQQHPAWGLLQQNEASDWADIMPRSGFVLYTNALWYWVKRLYGRGGAELTREVANQLFDPFGGALPASRRLRLITDTIREQMDASPVWLSFVNLHAWGDEADLFANLLALLSGLAPAAQQERVASAVVAFGADRRYPLRVIGTPIEPGAAHWRPYMLRHHQNLPWQYHNGGIWPFVGGFWVLALQRMGRSQQAWHALENLARASSVNDWEFNEWFHGTSGAPMGMAGQSWNAAMYLLAWKSLNHQVPWPG